VARLLNTGSQWKFNWRILFAAPSLAVAVAFEMIPPYRPVCIEGAGEASKGPAIDFVGTSNYSDSDSDSDSDWECVDDVPAITIPSPTKARSFWSW